MEDKNENIKQQNKCLKKKIESLENALKPELKNCLKLVKKNSWQDVDHYISRQNSETIKASFVSSYSLANGSTKLCYGGRENFGQEKSKLVRSNDFFKATENGTAFKRYRPKHWLAKDPSKKFLNSIAISQLPAFKF